MNVIVFDTETANDLDCPMMYDLGFAVVNLETEQVLYTASLVIKEVFEDEELMASAYFIDKVPQYVADIESGKRRLVSLKNAKWLLNDICRKYGVKYLSAHNACFDYRSTATTQRYMTSSKYRYFLPYGVKLIDTLKLARKVFKSDDNYGEFCYENDYLTKRGQRRYTAEILYRYLSKDNDFIEEHCGLEDVMIEKDILLYCLSQLPIDEGVLWE